MSDERLPRLDPDRHGGGGAGPDRHGGGGGDTDRTGLDWRERIKMFTGGSGRPGQRYRGSPRELNHIGQNATPEKQTHPSGTMGDPMALLYGYGVHAGTPIFRALRSDGMLVVAILWGQGPIHEFVRFTMNGEELPATVLVEHYRGDSGDSNYGTVSPLCVSARATYADTLVDTDAETGAPIQACYSVFGVPPNASQSWPTFRAWIRGHPVYDRRDVTQDELDESTWKYSANAALVQADVYSHPTRGLNLPISWISTQEAADDCDTVRSRECHLRIQDLTEGEDVVAAIGEYARCEIDADGQNGRQYPLKNETPVAHLTRNDCMGANFTGASKSGRERPDIIYVDYTHIDPSDPYKWSTKRVKAVRPGLVGNAQPYAIQRLSMPGYHNRDMAYRYAVDRLNELRGDIRVAWTAPDTGLKYLRGDVVTITDDNGLSSFRVRIDRIQVQSHGSYRFTAREDAPAMYSGEPAPDEPNIDPGLPSVYNPAPPANIILAEEVYRARDDRWRTRLCVKWDLSTYTYPHEYNVEVLAADDTVLWASPAVSSTARVFRTGQVQDGVSYTARVQTATRLFRGDWGLSNNYTAQGKLLPPGTPPAFQAWSVNGEIFASWDEGADLDVERYRLTYAQITGPSPDPQPASGLFLGLADSLEFRSTRLSEGTWRIWCYAIDSVKQPSTTPAQADITITKANDAYLVGSQAIALDTSASNNISTIYRDRNHDSFEHLIDDGTPVTTLFPGSDMSLETGAIAAKGYAAVLILDADASFIVLSKWNSQNAAADTGGDGHRLKLTGSGSIAYTLHDTISVNVGTHYQFTIRVEESSGTPAARLVYREGWPGGGSNLAFNGATSETVGDDGVKTFKGVVWSSTTSLSVGIEVTATDGSYIIVDAAELKEIHEFVSQSLDLGSVLNSSLLAVMKWTDYDDMANAQIETSSDGSVWTEHAVLSIRTSARYARVRVTTFEENRFLLASPIGTIYSDVAAQKRNGTITSLTNGAWDYQADGAHQASSASLFDFTGDLTISVRYRADTFGTSSGINLCGKLGDTGTGLFATFSNGSGEGQFFYRHGAGSSVQEDIVSDFILNSGETYVFTIRRNSTNKTVELWLDGVLIVGPQQYSVTLLSDTTNLFNVAGLSAFNNCDGQMSDLAIWTAAISDDEIRNHAYNVSTRSSNLYAHYEFGGTGMSLTDSSGNGRTLSASTGLGSTDDHVTVGVPAWELLSEQLSAVKSFSFTAQSEDPASFGVPKIQLLPDRFAFGVLARLDGSPVAQSALYQLEAV